MIFSLLTTLLCFTLHVCEDNDNSGNDDGKSTEATLVQPEFDRLTPLRNPLNGWVMYAPRTAGPSYWDTEFFVPELGRKVKPIDYASACYLRVSWRLLNPQPGVYAWRDKNTQISQLIQGALDKGLPVAFRIVVDGRDQGLNTPQFVFDAGARYYLADENNSTRRTPYPQDEVFKSYYTTLIEELAKDFNDPVKCAFVDAYGLGKWGEAHNVIYESVGEKTTANTEKLKEEVFEWVTDLYARTFTKVPLVINYHRLVGHPASWGSANENSSKLLTSAINKGYSIRHDAFGMTDYYQNWEEQFAADWAYQRPIIMEGGWITGGTHRYWIDSSKKYREGHPEDVRKGEFDLSAEAHVNMMDFRAGYETETWFTRSFSLVQRFIAEGGYRLYPDQVYLPKSIKSGSSVSIKHRWRNVGWGYFPNNIPQWNYKYKVAFALLDAGGNAVKVFVDTDSEPSKWLKKSTTSYDFETIVDVASGNYTWAVAIVDTKNGNKPDIQLAVSNEKTTSGWTKLLEVIVKKQTR